MPYKFCFYGAHERYALEHDCHEPDDRGSHLQPPGECANHNTKGERLLGPFSPFGFDLALQRRNDQSEALSRASLCGSHSGNTRTDHAWSTVPALPHVINWHSQDAHTIVLALGPVDHGSGGGGAPPSAWILGELTDE